VNGARIQSKVLANGDSVRIGDCEMRFLAADRDVTPDEALRLMTISDLPVDLHEPSREAAR